MKIWVLVLFMISSCLGCRATSGWTKVKHKPWWEEDNPHTGPYNIPQVEKHQKSDQKSLRPRLELAVGSAPRSESHARLAQSFYSLLGWGTDNLVEAIIKEPGSGQRWVRISKGLLMDLPLAWLHTVYLHEMGHIETAWRVNSPRVSLRPMAGHFTLGQVVNFSPEGLDRQQINQIVIGGLFAGQSAARWLYRRFFASQKAVWSELPLYIYTKLDSSIYIFHTLPFDKRKKIQQNDIVGYRNSYGYRARKTLSEIDTHLYLGAILNLLDPGLIWATWAYANDYLLDGKKWHQMPGLNLQGLDLNLGTAFWLADTGPQYRFDFSARFNQQIVLHLSPTLSVDGQWCLEARIENLIFSPDIKGGFLLGIWQQRRKAEADLPWVGGIIGAGVTLATSQSTELALEVAWKANGELLAFAPEEGFTIQSWFSWQL
jgi:hypothetical protein